MDGDVVTLGLEIGIETTRGLEELVQGSEGEGSRRPLM